jgi:hypothetical protein
VAGHRRENVLDLLAEQQRLTVLGEVVGEVGEELFRVGAPERGGHRADQHRGGAEAFEGEAVVGELRGALFEAVAGRFVELDDFGPQQRLAGSDSLTRPGGAQALEREALVRGVLVDDDQAVGGLGDDVSVGDLAAGDAERLIGGYVGQRFGHVGAALGSGEEGGGFTHQ